MKKISNVIVLLFLVSLGFISCDQKPKVVTATSDDSDDSNDSERNSGIFSEKTFEDESDSNGDVISDDVHTVVVNEVLPTEKYAYLKVTENEKEFWIATRSKDAKVGETYHYKGGLLKTNFESKEHNRIFDKVYLISNLVSANHSHGTSEGHETEKVAVNDYSESDKNTSTKKVIPMHTNKIIEHKGSIKIANLVHDPEKYAGKTVQISGVCTKINPAIMERNWIHLKDGSMDDFDMVVTSDTYVPEGSTITIKALVTLNKDFGAGYKYDLILEDGVLVE